MNDFLRRLVEIWLQVVVNVQENQFLYITLPNESKYLKEIIFHQAQKLKVREVFFQEVDSYCQLLEKYGEDISQYSQSLHHSFSVKNELLKQNCAYLEICRGIDLYDKKHEKKILELQKIKNEYTSEFRKNRRDIGNIVSCKTVIPTYDWAREIFGDESDVLAKLWDVYFSITLANQENSIEIWKMRIDEIQKKVKYLNDKQFKSLVFETRDSHLCVDLIDNHVWVGGCEMTDSGICYMPNFPTQEIFTAPRMMGVNGIFSNTKPLCYEGIIIDHFQLTFENGKVISYQANQNETLLKEIIDADEGSCFCGEIAILPGQTEISKENIIFKNTILDENAACHLALGRAYQCNINEKIDYKKEDYNMHEMNFSKIHVDVMFGNQDINIMALSNDNEIVELIKSGKWVI